MLLLARAACHLPSTKSGISRSPRPVHLEYNAVRTQGRRAADQPRFSRAWKADILSRRKAVDGHAVEEEGSSSQQLPAETASHDANPDDFRNAL